MHRVFEKRNTRLFLEGIRYIFRTCWSGVGAIVLRMGYPHHFVTFKRFVVRRYVGSLGANSRISPGFFVFRGYNTHVGMRCDLGYHFQIFDFEPVRIGDNLLASHNITIIAGTHKNDANRTYIPGPIEIGSNVWLGANVLIVGPCSIGDNCIVGANSFVNRSYPPDSVIGGSPARIIRRVTELG
jgi:maltose O-acetyltransferase